MDYSVIELSQWYLLGAMIVGIAYYMWTSMQYYHMHTTIIAKKAAFFGMCWPLAAPFAIPVLVYKAIKFVCQGAILVITSYDGNKKEDS
jgi:hypothetical protein